MRFVYLINKRNVLYLLLYKYLFISQETETSSHSRIIPIDNTTVRFIPRLGFILDMEVKPEPKGRFSCNANNLRTGKMEVLGFHLKPEGNNLSIAAQWKQLVMRILFHF